MPAHTVAADVGRRRNGNGALLTAVDRDGNDAADQLAKLAVRGHRVPPSVRKAIAAQEQQVTAMAWWVARVTVAANAWGPQQLRDSDSAPPRYGPREPRARRARHRPEEIPVALGGHDVLYVGAQSTRRWQCRVCHRTAKARATLACARCAGSAVLRWASQAVAAAGGELAAGGRHTLLLTGTVVWCFRCGANACVQARGLAKPCRGRLLGFQAQAFQRLLLGLHPATREPLAPGTVPEPGASLPPGYAGAVRYAQLSATSAAARCVRPAPLTGVPAARAAEPARDPLAPGIPAPMLARVRARAALAAAARTGGAAPAGAGCRAAPAQPARLL